MKLAPVSRADLLLFSSLGILNKDTAKLAGFEEKKEKGAKNGRCNRSACNSGGNAIHYNRATRFWYCTPCAREINEWGPKNEEPLCDWPTEEQMDGRLRK